MNVKLARSARRTGARGVSAVLALAALALPAVAVDDPDLNRAPAARDVRTGPTDLEPWIELALDGHPEIRAVRNRIEAARQRAPQARALADPEIGYGYFIEPIETRTGPQRHRISFSQRLPWFGTLARREAAANADVTILQEQLRQFEFDVIHELQSHVSELAFLEASIALTRENVEVLRRFEAIARRRYELATTSHPDVVRVQLEIGRLEDRLTQLEETRPVHVAAINERLGRAADAPFDTPPLIDDVTDESLPALLDELAASPTRLRPFEASLTRQDLLTDLATRAARPSFRFGFAYQVTGDARFDAVPGDGEDAMIAEIGLTLPIWRRKNRARVAESESIARSLTDAREAERQRLATRVTRAHFAHRDADRQVEPLPRHPDPAHERLAAQLGHRLQHGER